MTHDSPEYSFAKAVLVRSQEIRRDRLRDFLSDVTAAVQIGVARAFGAKA